MTELQKHVDNCSDDDCLICESYHADDEVGKDGEKA